MCEGEQLGWNLQELHGAGLTHVHLLPSYDFGSVPEKAADQQVPQVHQLYFTLP